MAGVYIYSDHSDFAAELIGYAKGTGNEANVIVFNQKDVEALRNKGADTIYILDAETQVVENYGNTVAQFLKDKSAELFMVGSTARGRDLAAQVAGYLDCGMVSEVSSVSYEDGKILTERLIYGGALVLKETLNGLGVLTVPPGIHEHIEGEANVVSVKVNADSRIQLVKTAPIVKEGVDLSAAEKVVCVGLGIDKEEDVQIARDLAEVLGAELACSRGVAEERHWLPVEQYIGISGAKISPQLYLGMGVSGQVQHIIGVRDSKIIVAVNNNEKAPIFKACDYGIVGDMYEIIPLLTEALKK